MKSLFSCFPKRKSKSKSTKNNKSQSQVITETKLNVQNHCNIEFLIEEEKFNENNTDQCQDVLVNEVVIDNEVGYSEEVIGKLEVRLKNALSRIENVYSVLNYKNKMYIISDVIMDFKRLFDSEFNKYILQSEQLGEIFSQQASYVSELFNIQSDLIKNIQNRDFKCIEDFVIKLKFCVIELNKLCGKDNDKFELHRLIADSIMIFGWICCLNSPSQFSLNVLDGCVMVAAKMVNDTRYSKYSDWLKSWIIFMKAFNSIVSKHFEAALMWRIDGPIPIDIMSCLIMCNYSNFKEEQKAGKAKVVKTTAVNDISYETVTNLFDDLRNGRQKSKLRSVKNKESEMEDEQSVILKPEKPVSEKETSDATIVVKLDKPAYILRDKIWIINNETGNADIEIPNKERDHCVMISDCNDCSIQIDGVVEDVTIENCSNISVITDEITRRIVGVKSTNIECQVLGTVGEVRLTEVSQFRLFVPKQGSENMMLVTGKCGDIDLYVSNDVGGGDGLELEDYDLHHVATQCRSILRDGVMMQHLVQ